MNYKNIYKQFIEYCLNNSVEYRLKNRNKKDYRLNKAYVYLENHHIKPTHDKGLDEGVNMVKLLPEEHIFAHMIRWKAYKQRGDMLAVRFCLNGIDGIKCKSINDIKPILTKKLRSGYSWIKQNSAEVRKTHGWHTSDGLKRISEARKGQIPVVDAITRESKGCVTKDHPKYLSGEWVHHSKGKRHTELEKKHLSKINSGFGNFNSINITDTEIVDLYSKYSLKEGRIISFSKFLENTKNDGIRVPKSLSKFRFNGNGQKELIKRVEEKTKIIYNPYFKSEEVRRKISISIKELHDKNKKNK